ncbi:ribose-5-phosphate isomerase [Mycoplasmopsis maculosa]|uniref:Ribose-5-phosphate isomerase n=1 Tax=Mycoplasmopsis maculosa TaxID=114885 RepID=A0A449B552_9BACT|nr:RpiB/LacA/LacB family sugar-phosphate isomerase [Mycoplasmopsis maculosa]VEU75699.1 ribose-5-phosphate isomerase [Mycoplasmopsis maculosa]
MGKKVVFASDHAAVELKNELRDYVKSMGYEVVDLGPEDNKVSTSYATQGHKLADYVKHNDVEFGVGMCGTGLGISYALNRHSGIRAARVTSVEDSRLAKLHNNANVIVFSGRYTPVSEAKAMLNEYIKTEFEGGRHESRIEQIEEFEE